MLLWILFLFIWEKSVWLPSTQSVSSRWEKFPFVYSLENQWKLKVKGSSSLNLPETESQFDKRQYWKVEELCEECTATLLIILTYLVGRKFRWNQLYHNHKEDHCQWRYIFLRFGMDCLKHKHRKLSILLPEIVWKTSLYVVTNLVSKLCIIHSTPKRILDDPPM